MTPQVNIVCTVMKCHACTVQVRERECGAACGPVKGREWQEGKDVGKEGRKVKGYKGKIKMRSVREVLRK